jgi:hypothetical protein
MFARILVLTIAVLSLAVSAFANWTQLPLRDSAKIVYVSSSMGDDTNDGLTPATPKRTLTGTPAPTPTNPYNRIPGAFAAITNGAGDHLYLRRGDTFSEAAPLQWNKSGFSAEYPAVLGAYGVGPRPIIDRGTEMAMIVSSISGPTVRHVAIVGIHFLAAQRDWRRPGFTAVTGGPGIFVASGVATAPQIVDDLLIEDCRFEFLGQGIALVGPYFDSIRNVRINRNIFVDIYVPNGHTNGIFAANVTGLMIKENLIDGVQRTAIAAGVPNVHDTALSHSAYIQSDSRDVVMRNNIVANSFDGGMMRPGGIYRNNLVIGGTIGSHHGYMFSASAPIITGGVIPWVVGNVFLRPAQFGIQMGNVSFGLAEKNVVLGGPAAGARGFNLIGRTDQTVPAQVGVHNLTLRGNYILGMEGLGSAGPVISNVTVDGNQFRSGGRVVTHDDWESADFHYVNNAYRSEGPANQWFRVNNTNYDFLRWTILMGELAPVAATFVDPATVPTIAGYGMGSESDFLTATRQQSRENWDDRYTAGRVIQYLRQQLGLPPL